MGPPTVPGFDGTQQSNATYAGNTVTNPPPSSSISLPDFILRAIAVITTFLAAIVMGATKQTVTVGDVKIKLKTTGKGMSQLEFFIAANSIAFVYLAVSLALKVVKRGPSARSMVAVISMVDLVMVGFVFSAVGSGAAVSVNFHDDDSSGTNICDTFDSYCRGIAAAIAMSTLGAVALLALVLLVLLGIYSV